MAERLDISPNTWSEDLCAYK